GVSTGLASKVISFGVYLFWRSSLHLSVSAFHVLSGGTICGVFALISPFTASNSEPISLVLLHFRGGF
ncbi:hypothetical protein ACEV8U_23130, partial [Vibrio parahaemolyticus]